MIIDPSTTAGENLSRVQGSPRACQWHEIMEDIGNGISAAVPFCQTGKLSPLKAISMARERQATIPNQLIRHERDRVSSIPPLEPVPISSQKDIRSRIHKLLLRSYTQWTGQHQRQRLPKDRDWSKTLQRFGIRLVCHVHGLTVRDVQERYKDRRSEGTDLIEVQKKILSGLESLPPQIYFTR